MQHDAADELHVEVPHVQRALAGFPHHRERIGQQIVQRLAVGETRAELVGLRAQGLVRELLDLRFFRADHGCHRPQPLQFAIVGGADDFRQEGVNNHQERS